MRIRRRADLLRAALAGKRLPDSGEGFTTRAVWKTRGNRYGTDELLVGAYGDSTGAPCAGAAFLLLGQP